MGTLVVVVGHPLVKSLLGGLEVGESRSVAQEFGAHTAVEPLNFARRGRRTRLGQQVLNAVFAADRIKEHLDRRMMKPPGEDLAVEFLRDVKPRRLVYGGRWTGRSMERVATPCFADPSPWWCAKGGCRWGWW